MEHCRNISFSAGFIMEDRFKDWNIEYWRKYSNNKILYCNERLHASVYSF